MEIVDQPPEAPELLKTLFHFTPLTRIDRLDRPKCQNKRREKI